MVTGPARRGPGWVLVRVQACPLLKGISELLAGEGHSHVRGRSACAGARSTPA